MPEIEKAMASHAKKQKAMLDKYPSNKSNILVKAAKFITDIQARIPEMIRLATKAGKNSGKLINIFTSDRICTDSASSTGAKLNRIMGQPKPNLIKAELNLLEGLLIKKAHAATTDHFYMTLGFTAGLSLIVDGSLSLTIATDFKGSWGLFMSESVGAISNVAGGGEIALGFYPKVGLSDFVGAGWSISGSAGPPSKAFSGGVSFDINKDFNDLQGVSINAALGAGLSPVDLSLDYSFTQKIVGK